MTQLLAFIDHKDYNFYWPPHANCLFQTVIVPATLGVNPPQPNTTREPHSPSHPPTIDPPNYTTIIRIEKTHDEKLKTTITETWHLCSHRCCPISEQVLHSRHCQRRQRLIEQAEEALLVLLPWLLTLRQDVHISRQTEERTFLPLELSVLDGRSSLTTNRVGQHLAIRSDWPRNKAAYIRLDLSLLRSLTASGEWKPFSISQKMRVLRVLDLEGTCNLEDGHLDEIGQLMPRLKFLSLRGCKPISCLPDSLGDLTLLETLDVRHTDITVLPKTITKLQKLQHIRAGPAPAVPTQQDEQRPGQSWWSTLSASARACLSKSPGGGNRRGVEVPRGMGGMKALHTLGVVDVDMPGGKALLAELRKKNKNMKKNKEKKKKGDESHALRNLSLCGLNCSQHLLHCISSLDQLESLSIRAEKLQVEHFSLPPNLVKLSLHVAGILHQGAVDAVKDHGKLQTLRLHAKEVENDDTVSFSAATKAGEFGGEVRILEISCSSSFRVMFSQQAMQNLELLIVHCSSGSPSEISGLEQLGALKQVWLTGSCDDTLKKALEEQLPEHQNKPALTLNMEE